MGVLRVVRPTAGPTPQPVGLVCIDGSKASEAVLAGAAMFASLADASCVVGPDEDVAMDDRPPMRPVWDQAERHCRQAAERLAATGIAATAQVLNGQAVSSIVAHADERAASDGDGRIRIGAVPRTRCSRIQPDLVGPAGMAGVGLKPLGRAPPYGFKSRPG